jgi:UDP-GlcNAc:undecaprenyl-phosphate GlcNAc-1-phosphate transferase
VWHVAAIKFAAAFAAVAFLIYLLEPLARRIGLLDRPGGRKDHHAPTPVTGGLAIAVGTIIPGILLTEPTPALLGLGVAAAILLIVGLIDDLVDLPWRLRVLAQAIAALAMILVGGVQVEWIGVAFGLAPMELGYLSIPFTVIATVGLINALNMVDGLDGLAGTQALCALAMLIAAAIYAGNTELVNGLFAMAGAVAGFLAFNMRWPWQPRARVFLGNSGSAYLGVIIAWASFRLTQNANFPVTPVLAPFLIALPVIDCLVLIVRRIMHRRSPFDADRTHVHHLMLDAGFTVTGVVLTLSTLSLALGLAAAMALRANVPQPAFIVAYLALIAAYFIFSRHPQRASRCLARLIGRAPAATATVAPELAE